MRKGKVIAVLLAASVFMAFALGSGSSSSSTHDSVKVEPNGSSETTATTADANNETTADIEYEISDTNFEYYTNSIGVIEYYGYVEITNTGSCDIYMKDCVFDLEDNNGHLLQSDSFISHCPEVISPGEKGYFFNGIGSSSLDESISLDNGVNLVPQISLKKASGKPHSYPVSDVDFRAGDYGDVKVTGRVENDTDEAKSYLSVYTIFRDGNGKVIAIDTTTVMSEVGPGNKGSFDSSTMFGNENLKLENIKDVEVICEDDNYQF